MCSLWANHARLQGRTLYRGRVYKVCPILDCPEIVAEMPVHLPNCHCMASNQVSLECKKAVPITKFSLSLPNLDEFDLVEELCNPLPTSPNLMAILRDSDPSPGYQHSSSSEAVPPMDLQEKHLCDRFAKYLMSPWGGGEISLCIKPWNIQIYLEIPLRDRGTPVLGTGCIPYNGIHQA